MKKRFIKFTFIVMILIIGALLALNCHYGIRGSRTADYIKELIEDYKKGELETIPIAEINFFEWDRVHIYGPYTRCSQIIQPLRAPYYWLRCKMTNIESHEFLVLFVFTRNGLITGDAITPISRDIDYSSIGFAKENAYFVLDGQWLYLWNGN